MEKWAALQRCHFGLITVYMIFSFINLIGLTVIYFFAVETKQLSLEDLEFVFNSNNPKKASLELQRTVKARAKEAHEAAGV